MAQPTDEAIYKIRSYVNTEISGGFNNTTIYLMDMLNNIHYSGNPISQQILRKPFNSTNIFSVLSSSGINKVLQIPATTSDVLPLLNDVHTETNIYWCNVWGQAYYEGGSITLDEYIAVTGVINAYELDPYWVSGVSWSQVELNRFATIEDIDYSR